MADGQALEASVIVTVDHRFVRSDGKEISITKSKEIHEPKVFTTTPAIVRRGFGVTLNQGNYESSRVDVGIDVPCYLEDAERADAWARDFCATRLKEEVLALKADEKQGQKI